MSSYGGYPGPEQVPPPPPTSAYAGRADRFWSSPPTSGSGVDPWGTASNSYTPQLDFSTSSYLPYPQPNGLTSSSSPSSTSGGGTGGSGSDLTFSGPSPPNPTQLQPISYPPPPSPLTPKVHGQGQQGQHHANGLNNGGPNSNHHSSSSASNSPPNNNGGGGGSGSRSFSYLDDVTPQNPTSLQNGHPSNGGGGSTLLTLGGGGGTGNKNELINGHPTSNEGSEGGYRGGNGSNGPSSRYPGESSIKSEPGSSDYYQSYYQNYTPTTTIGGGQGQSQSQGQGQGQSYSQQPHPYYQQPQDSSYPKSTSTQNQSLTPYDPYHPQGHPHQMYSQSTSSYHDQSDHYGQNPYSSPPPPERKHSIEASPPGNNYSSSTSILTSDRVSYPDPLGQSHAQGQGSSSPPSTYRGSNYPPTTPTTTPAGPSNSPPSVKIEKKLSPPQNNAVSPPQPLPPPPTKAKNGKGKKGQGGGQPPPPTPEDKKGFPDKKAPPPKKKRKKRTKPLDPAGRSPAGSGKDKKDDFHRVKDEPGTKEGKGRKGQGSNCGVAAAAAAAKLHLRDREDRDDLDLGDPEGGEYDDDKEGKADVPMVECGCFPADEVHAEPGPFYTHLGAARDLVEMRKLIEGRTGFRGNQLRLEKVIYTGKEGKTSVGCPLAKWILRRGSFEEQLLFLVKHRKGHKCGTAWIVVCCVIWEGVPPHFSDNLYDTLVYKLNRFGIPTTRRSDTNEQRSCACQGVDPDTCGAAYSFGCAWSMFFNGCKYARSRNVRKFRLTEEHEESELEEKVQHLATHLAPLYERVAQDSYTNQIDHENEGLECRLGYRPGRPFSGVTACLDYCSHAHKDAHNMMNGCTVTVSLARHRTLTKPDDEQYHVLPLYKLDDTDEHGSKEGQKAKVKKGQLEILKKFPCKVRIRKVPLLPSRRRAKAKSSGANNAGGGGTGGGGSGSREGSTAKNEATPVTPTPKVGNPGGSGGNLIGDYSSSDLPLPPKREKLFDERLSNGGVEGYGGEGRFGSSGYGSSGVGGHSFNDLSSSTPSLWNSHPFSGSGSSPSSSSRVGGGGGVGGLSHAIPPPTSYFDHHGGLGGPGGSGSLGGTSSSLSSLTELTNSTISRHGSASTSSNLGGGTTSGSTSGTNLLSSPGSSGGNPGSASSSGYSSMSPILPSFRNTFMTEAESLGLSSSSSSDQQQSQPHPQNTSSSPRSKHHHSHSHSSTPAFQDHSSGITTSSSQSHSHSHSHQSPYYSGSSNQSHHYSGGSGGGGGGSSHQAPPPPGGLYHPQPHNPCLPPHPGSPYHHPHSHPSSYHSHGHSSHHQLVDPGHGPGSYGSTFPPSLSGWSSAAAAAAAYSSNYAAAAASAYSSAYAPSNFGMGSMPMTPMTSMGMNPMNMGPMAHHHQYSHHSPYHSHTHPGMGGVGGVTSNLNMNMNLPLAGPPRSNPQWGQSHQFNVNPFSSGSGHPHPGMNMNSMTLGGMGSGGVLPPGGLGGTGPVPPPPSCFVTPPKPKVIPEVNESSSDNEDCFKDPAMGGVAIALTHGSVILQCAKHEMHATTALKAPNRMYPSRICLIFYQHKSMNNRFHGWSEWEKKIEAKKLQEVKLINQGKMEASPRKMKQLIKEGYIQDSQ